MLGPLFFFFEGIFITIMAHKKKALWLTRGGICMILLAPLTYFMRRPDAHWTIVPLLTLTTVMVFCIVVGMVKREQFLLSKVDP
ncbi:MAG: hypothetical protein GIW97_03000 [Candidatus Eremiobacteraeota bacterium]|nr:hypothetical protein [Candidatus Eremiobacteraeota bacterium]